MSREGPSFVAVADFATLESEPGPVRLLVAQEEAQQEAQAFGVDAHLFPDLAGVVDDVPRVSAAADGCRRVLISQREALPRANWMRMRFVWHQHVIEHHFESVALNGLLLPRYFGYQLVEPAHELAVSCHGQWPVQHLCHQIVAQEDCRWRALLVCEEVAGVLPLSDVADRHVQGEASYAEIVLPAVVKEQLPELFPCAQP